MTIREMITKSIGKSLLDMEITDIPVVLEHPAIEEQGDYSTNVALVGMGKWRVESGKWGEEIKNPRQLAEKIVEQLRNDEELKDVVEKIEIAGPGFINFRLSTKTLVKALEERISHKDAISTVGKGKKVVVEYSSPNIAKPFTIGHLRSTIIGDAVANLLEACGWTVYRDNHVGDWGTQFGKLIYAIKAWGNEKEIQTAQHPVKELVFLYVKFHQEAELHPELEDEARLWFKKLEEGDHEARLLWQWCIDLSWKEFNDIYETLDVHFTENNGRGYGESFFEDKMTPVVAELEEKRLLKESEGAKLVFFPNDIFPPLMIMKKDGATLYSTRDLATDKFRLEKYGKDVVVINEVGAEQSLYFQQLYKVEHMAGWYQRGQRVHVKHGFYRFKDEKMSTRKGNVIWLEDVLHEAIERAYTLASDESFNINYEDTKIVKIKSEIHKRNKFDYIMGEEEAKTVAKQVGIGALKWNDLKRSSHQDIVFDWDDLLTMEGNSGPYMQYTYARAKSVLRQAGKWKVESGKWKLNNEELAVLRWIYRFPEVVEQAARSYSPNLVCTFLFDLAQRYNHFYHEHSILKAETEKQKEFRLLLTQATAQVLHNGLTLLGIKTPEKM